MEEERFECLTDDFAQVAKGEVVTIRNDVAYDQDDTVIKVDIDFIKTNPDCFTQVEIEDKKEPEKKRLPDTDKPLYMIATEVGELYSDKAEIRKKVNEMAKEHEDIYVLKLNTHVTVKRKVSWNNL